MGVITRNITICATLLLTGCSVNPVTGGGSFNLISESQEFNLGHKVVSEEIAHYGLYKDNPKLVATYRKLGQKIVAVSERPDKPYEFLLLDAEVFNAAAIPGYVMTYRGLLPFMNSEAELAMILGHEVGHIAARHSARSLSNRTLASILVTGAAIYGASRSDNSATAQAAYVLGGVAAVIGLQSFSRSYEREADTLGIRYLQALGYPPEHAYSVFKAMDINRKMHEYMSLRLAGQVPNKSGFYHILRSHPDPKERMRRVINEVGKPAKPAVEYGTYFGNDTIGRDKYLNLIDNLAYGPTPKEGVMARNYYYNSAGQFRLSVPDGFVFQYFYGEGKGKGFWRGHSAKNNMLMTVANHNSDTERNSEEILRILAPRARGISFIKANGRTIATGSYWQEEAGKVVGFNRVYIVPLVAENSEDYEQIGRKFIILKFTAGDDAIRYAGKQSNRQNTEELFNQNTFDQDIFGKFTNNIINSFRPLSKQQARNLSPLRVKVHTVRNGDTIEKLAERMSFSDMRLEMLHALNGLPQNYTLKPQQKIKLVVNPNN